MLYKTCGLSFYWLFAAPDGMLGKLVLLENKSRRLEMISLPSDSGSKHSFQELKVRISKMCMCMCMYVCMYVCIYIMHIFSYFIVLLYYRNMMYFSGDSYLSISDVGCLDCMPQVCSHLQ